MLLWVDVETTGLDPDKDALLEVALVVTTNELQVCHEESWVLPFKAYEPNADIHPVVKAMHEKNGLWAECAKVCVPIDSAPNFRKAQERQILSVLRRWTEKGKVPICGSTVSFDRAFLKRHMPEVEAHFSHRHVDVSSIGELAERLYPEAWAKRPKGDAHRAHRALPDILQSIALLRYWRETVLR